MLVKLINNMSGCLFCTKTTKETKKFCSRECYYSHLKSCTGSKNGFFGRTHSREVKSFLSMKASLRTHSEETKKKIGLAQKGILKGSMAEKSKKKLSARIKKQYQNGRIVWNKGLSKETNVSVKSTSEKLSGIGRLRIGKKNPFFGKHHSAKTKSLHSKFMKGRFTGEKNAFFGKTHDEKTRNKLSKLGVERSKLPEVKVRLRKQGVDSVLMGKKHSTKIELMVKNELMKRNIDFIFQYKFRDSKGQYVCVGDFAFPEHKLILEVNGDFHHANPKLYLENELKPIQVRTIENDERKKELYRRECWELMVLWGSDIKENITECIDSISKKLKAHP